MDAASAVAAPQHEPHVVLALGAGEALEPVDAVALAPPVADLLLLLVVLRGAALARLPGLGGGEVAHLPLRDGVEL